MVVFVVFCRNFQAHKSKHDIYMKSEIGSKTKHDLGSLELCALEAGMLSLNRYLSTLCLPHPLHLCNTIEYKIMCMVNTFSRDQPGKVANPVRGQPNREILSLSAFAPENLVSRDRFGRSIPHQPAQSPHSG